VTATLYSTNIGRATFGGVYPFALIGALSIAKPSNSYNVDLNSAGASEHAQNRTTQLGNADVAPWMASR
jgi:hypothetical protein